MSLRKCTKGGRKPNICRCMLGAVLSWRMFGKAPSEMSALQPYRGKPAVRNDREDRGNVGIIEARSAPRSYPTPISGHERLRIAAVQRGFGTDRCHVLCGHTLPTLSEALRAAPSRPSGRAYRTLR